jgi:hypothetical protein
MKDFIPYEEALELKKLGFDEPCFTWYWDDIGMYNGLELGNHNKHINYVSTPTFSQAFRFFREKYELYAWVNVEYEYGGIIPTYYITGKRQGDIPGGPFNTYEEAELECLRKLIEIAKQKQ